MTKVLPILVGVTVVATIGLLYQFFKVKSVEVVETTACLSSQDSSFEESLVGKNIFLIQKDQIEAKLKTNYDCIDQIKIDRHLPSNLKITTTVKGPVARISDSLAVSENGLVVESQANLPILFLNGNQPKKAGEQLTGRDILFALQVIKALLQADFLASNIRIVDPKNIAFYNRQGLVVLFTSDKEADLQIDSLQYIISRSKIDATKNEIFLLKIAKIDLRFDKPVIVYKNNGQR